MNTHDLLTVGTIIIFGIVILSGVLGSISLIAEQKDKVGLLTVWTVLLGIVYALIHR